jgi:hypothetical protein
MKADKEGKPEGLAIRVVPKSGGSVSREDGREVPNAQAHCVVDRSAHVGAVDVVWGRGVRWRSPWLLEA